MARRQVMVELRPQTQLAYPSAQQLTDALDVEGFEVDQDFSPVTMTGGAQDTVVVRGTIEDDARERLAAAAAVVAVHDDTIVAPFGQPRDIPSG